MKPALCLILLFLIDQSLVNSQPLADSTATIRTISIPDKPPSPLIQFSAAAVGGFAATGALSLTNADNDIEATEMLVGSMAIILGSAGAVHLIHPRGSFWGSVEAAAIGFAVGALLSEPTNGYSIMFTVPLGAVWGASELKSR